MTHGIWTISTPVDQPATLGTQTNCGGVAKLTLRVAPHPEAAVGFSNGADLTDPAMAGLVPYVEEGVRDFERARAEQGRPIGYVHVTLIALWYHPVDSIGHRNRRAAYAAMQQAFDTYGSLLTDRAKGTS